MTRLKSLTEYHAPICLAFPANCVDYPVAAPRIEANEVFSALRSIEGKFRGAQFTGPALHKLHEFRAQSLPLKSRLDSELSATGNIGSGTTAPKEETHSISGRA